MKILQRPYVTNISQIHNNVPKIAMLYASNDSDHKQKKICLN